MKNKDSSFLKMISLTESLTKKYDRLNESLYIDYSEGEEFFQGSGNLQWYEFYDEEYKHKWYASKDENINFEAMIYPIGREFEITIELDGADVYARRVSFGKLAEAMRFVDEKYIEEVPELFRESKQRRIRKRKLNETALNESAGGDLHYVVKLLDSKYDVSYNTQRFMNMGISYDTRRFPIVINGLKATVVETPKRRYDGNFIERLIGREYRLVINRKSTPGVVWDTDKNAKFPENEFLSYVDELLEKVNKTITKESKQNRNKKRKLNESSYSEPLFETIENALYNAGLDVTRFSDAMIMSNNLGWVVSNDDGDEVQIECLGTW